MTSPQVLRPAVRPLAAAVVTAATTVGALVLTTGVARASEDPDPTRERFFGDAGEGLTVVETLLLYVAAPAVIFGLIALLVVGPSMGKRSKQRTFEDGPLWVDAAGIQRTPADTVRPDGPGATEEKARERRDDEPDAILRQPAGAAGASARQGAAGGSAHSGAAGAGVAGSHDPPEQGGSSARW